MNLHRLSLRSKLLLLSVLAVTTVLLGMGAFQFVSARRDLESALSADVDASAARLSTNLVAPVWDMSKEAAAGVIRAEMALPDVVAIAVKGSDGAPFAAVVRKGDALAVAEGGSAIPAAERTRAFEVRRGAEVIATGEIRYGTAALRAQLRTISAISIAQIVLVDLCLVAMLLAVLSALVLRPLGVLAREAGALRDAVGAGRLGVRGDPAQVPPEFRPVLEGLNATMDAYARPIALASEYVTRISQGDIPPAITERAAGDFARINEALNRCIVSVGALVEDVALLAEAGVDGKLSTRADAGRHQGEFRQIVEGVNRTLDAVVGPLTATARCVDAISRGEVPPRITDAWQGEFAVLRDNLNTCTDAIRALVSDATRLSAAAVAGQLSTRADAGRHHGDFRRIVQGVNDTLDAIVTPFQVLATYCERISHGDIPERRTNAVAGDLVTMQESLNRCIDALAHMVADVNGVVAAALEGRLSARIDASRHEGAFRAALDGVNRTLEAVVAPVHDAAAALERLAARDLSTRVEGQYQGDHARIVVAVNQTAEALSGAMAQVASTVDQVSSAAAQIASSSQAVASGASQQASSIEETSRSIEEVAVRTQHSAASADQAAKLGVAARLAADDGATAVAALHGAMGKIRQSAEGTSQIIKDVSDIAFQTNLLALNAAVEAARAGEAGRGFAVVAEEVRSLALRAKEAATKTEALIRESVKQTGEGEAAAAQVGTKLTEIVQGVSKVTGIVTEIAVAAKEQASQIGQVTRAVSEMDKVTQQNAASAEESSSAASELSSQAGELADMVGGFRLEREARRLRAHG